MFLLYEKSGPEMPSLLKLEMPSDMHSTEILSDMPHMCMSVVFSMFISSITSCGILTCTFNVDVFYNYET